MEAIYQTTLTKAQVLVADNHALFGEGISHLLGGLPHIRSVVSVTSADHAVECAGQLRPAVILLDPRLSGRSPFSLAYGLGSASPESRLLFLDETLYEMHLWAAIAVDACGYWTKEASFSDLADAVKLVLDGGWTFCPAAHVHLVESAGRFRFKPSSASAGLQRVTPREYEILLYVARGFSVKRCAECLGLSESTVDNHKSRLMRKLNVHKSVDLAWLAIRKGLVSARNGMTGTLPWPVPDRFLGWGSGPSPEVYTGSDASQNDENEA